MACNPFQTMSDINTLINNAIICPRDLVPGASLVFDGRNLRLMKCTCSGGENSASNDKVVALENLLREANEKIQTLSTNLVTANNKIAELERSQTTLEKWITVEFNNETEKRIEDSFVTANSMVDFSFLNGTPSSNLTTYVEDGFVTVTFEQPQTGTIQLQISKQK